MPSFRAVVKGGHITTIPVTWISLSSEFLGLTLIRSVKALALSCWFSTLRERNSLYAAWCKQLFLMLVTVHTKSGLAVTREMENGNALVMHNRILQCSTPALSNAKHWTPSIWMWKRSHVLIQSVSYARVKYKIAAPLFAALLLPIRVLAQPHPTACLTTPTSKSPSCTRYNAALPATRIPTAAPSTCHQGRCVNSTMPPSPGLMLTSLLLNRRTVLTMN